MTAAVGELLFSRNVASAQYVRHVGAQKGVIIEPPVNDQPKFFKAKARHARLAPDRNDDVVIGDRDLALGTRNDKGIARFKAERAMSGANRDAFSLQTRGHQKGSIGVLFQHQPIGHFDDGHM